VQTRSYVGDIVAEKNLPTDPRIEDLAIINLGELEMLEGLAEHGYGVVALLRGWKRSALRNVAFRNYLISEVEDHEEFRTRETRARIGAVLEDLDVRLITRDPEGQAARRRAGSEDAKVPSDFPGITPAEDADTDEGEEARDAESTIS
jgi:hypothetical protein